MLCTHSVLEFTPPATEYIFSYSSTFNVSPREPPVFSALVSPAEKNRRERSDDRKSVYGSQATLT